MSDRKEKKHKKMKNNEKCCAYLIRFLRSQLFSCVCAFF